MARDADMQAEEALLTGSLKNYLLFSNEAHKFRGKARKLEL